MDVCPTPNSSAAPDMLISPARYLLTIFTFSSGLSFCLCGITMLPPCLTVFYFTVSHRGSISEAVRVQLVEKVFSTSCLRFQNLQKVLKSIDLNGAGHPSWVHLRAKSRATPGCAPKRPAGQPRTPFLPGFLHFRVFRQPAVYFAAFLAAFFFFRCRTTRRTTASSSSMAAAASRISSHGLFGAERTQKVPVVPVMVSSR